MFLPSDPWADNPQLCDWSLHPDYTGAKKNTRKHDFVFQFGAALFASHADSKKLSSCEFPSTVKSRKFSPAKIMCYTVMVMFCSKVLPFLHSLLGQTYRRTDKTGQRVLWTPD